MRPFLLTVTLCLALCSLASLSSLARAQSSPQAAPPSDVPVPPAGAPLVPPPGEPLVPPPGEPQVPAPEQPLAPPPEPAPVAPADEAQGYPTPGYPVPTPSAESTVVSSRRVALLRVLDEDLEEISEQNDGRILDGSLQIGVGSLFIGLGVLFNEDDLLRSIMFLTGGVSVGRGINRLTLEPNASTPVLEFRHMPALDDAQVAAKLRYGEEALERLAKRMRAARLVDGSLTMFGAVSYVPLYWLLRHQNDSTYHFGDDGFDYVTVALAAIGFTAGLITVIRKSGAERRARAYRELKERFVSESPDEFTLVPRVTFGATASYAGARAVWQY